MKPALLKKLCCPVDKHDLTFQSFLKDENGDILEGLLSCAECQRYYPIVYGIPIMTPDEYREKSLEEPILARWGLELHHSDKKKLLLKGKA